MEAAEASSAPEQGPAAPDSASQRSPARSPAARSPARSPGQKPFTPGQREAVATLEKLLAEGHAGLVGIKLAEYSMPAPQDLAAQSPPPPPPPPPQWLQEEPRLQHTPPPRPRGQDADSAHSAKQMPLLPQSPTDAPEALREGQPAPEPASEPDDEDEGEYESEGEEEFDDAVSRLGNNDDAISVAVGGGGRREPEGGFCCFRGRWGAVDLEDPDARWRKKRKDAQCRAICKAVLLLLLLQLLVVPPIAAVGLLTQRNGMKKLRSVRGPLAAEPSEPPPPHAPRTHTAALVGRDYRVPSLSSPP